ncbi:hypothetical protein K0M31_002894, partial [Melipona bicolor]
HVMSTVGGSVVTDRVDSIVTALAVIKTQAAACPRKRPPPVRIGRYYYGCAANGVISHAGNNRTTSFILSFSPLAVISPGSPCDILATHPAFRIGQRRQNRRVPASREQESERSAREDVFPNGRQNAKAKLTNLNFSTSLNALLQFFLLRSFDFFLHFNLS